MSVKGRKGYVALSVRNKIVPLRHVVVDKAVVGASISHPFRSQFGTCISLFKKPSNKKACRRLIKSVHAQDLTASFPEPEGVREGSFITLKAFLYIALANLSLFLALRKSSLALAFLGFSLAYSAYFGQRESPEKCPFPLQVQQVFSESLLLPFLELELDGLPGPELWLKERNSRLPLSFLLSGLGFLEESWPLSSSLSSRFLFVSWSK